MGSVVMGKGVAADKGLNGAEESSDKEPRPAFKKKMKAKLQAESKKRKR